MVSLLDIAPSDAKASTVSVRGKDIPVRGLSMRDIAFLIENFSEVKDLFAGKDLSFDFDSLLSRAPNLVNAIILCGTDSRHLPGAAKVIESLSIEETVDLLEGIMNETFRGGLRPFVEKVTRVLGVASDIGTKASDSNGPKALNG